MLGHSDPAMTLRRYAHVLEDMREDAAIGRWTSSSREYEFHHLTH